MGCYLLQVSLALLSLLVSCQGFGCLDSEGRPVDWYMVYKTPDVHSASDWKIKEGLALFYLDKATPIWKLLDQPVNATEGHAVYTTLEQIYKSTTGDNILYVMYNDQRPESLLERNSGGHTKGVLASNGDQGFWMIQSTPKFPPKKDAGYKYPGTLFGQTFLCITFPFQSLGKVVHALRVNEPHMYDYNAPRSFQDKFPELELLLKGKPVSGPPWYSVDDLQSAGGDTFKVFAKSREFEADLYDALVAPSLKEDLLVETWLRSDGGPLDSNCSAAFKVYKVEDMSLPDGTSFAETKDHAKWAITADASTGSKTWKSSKTILFTPEARVCKSSGKHVCIGDINRMESQFYRGGGTVCVNNDQVWKAFKSTVAKYQKCV